MPDLVGLTKSAATDRLKALGLSAKIAQAYSPEVKKDVVMGQEPAGRDRGRAGGRGGPARLPRPRPEPDADTQPELDEDADARAQPTKTPTPKPTATPSPSPTVWPPEIEPPRGARRRLGQGPGPQRHDGTRRLRTSSRSSGWSAHVIEEPSEDYAKGLVMDQLPEAGRKIPQTYAVFLLVSSGLPAQAVPLPAEQ